jgi:oligopeptide/dipeptide ABC transporter ATP-binding protein
MSVIFITHDLGVIAELCHDVVVMYAGKVAETAPIRELFHNPRHPYTRGLLTSIPTLDSPHKQPLRVIKGAVPSLDNLPAGCRFGNRCPHARDVCRTAPPPLVEVGREHFAGCYFAADLDSWETVSGQEKTA